MGFWDPHSHRITYCIITAKTVGSTRLFWKTSGFFDVCVCVRSCLPSADEYSIQYHSNAWKYIDSDKYCVCTVVFGHLNPFFPIHVMHFVGVSDRGIDDVLDRLGGSCKDFKTDLSLNKNNFLTIVLIYIYIYCIFFVTRRRGPNHPKKKKASKTTPSSN